MSTLSEIEKAAAALSAEEQEALLRHLNGSPVPPPTVPKKELQRIHELVEAEFSRIDDWPSPAWHGEVLVETDRRLAEGKEEMLDWEDTKRKLRDKGA